MVLLIFFFTVPPLYLDMLCPSPLLMAPAPAVIYLHGGGWSEGARSSGLQPWLNPLLAAHGFITVSITYRLSQLAPFPAQIYDVKEGELGSLQKSLTR